MNKLVALLALFSSLLLFSIFSEVDTYSPVRSRRCPSLIISKAKVKLRGRGRLAKVTCNPGFQLLGDKFVVCEEGVWAKPLPSCIRFGCPSMKSLVSNAVIKDSYNGALVEVLCDTGYTLVGPSVLSCNGFRWNDTTPSCYLNEDTMHKVCDFESDDTCGWRNILLDNFDWKRHSMATASGHVGTGPEFDHTLGSGLNGHYLYIEASNRNIGDTARLMSPLYPPSSENTTHCFSFWYHMYGGHIGSLNVYIGQNLAFSETGNHGNRWIKAFIPVNHTSAPFQITIDGVRGNGYAGDIAIDDLKFSEGSDCLNQEKETDVILSGSCIERCNDNSTTDVDSCYCHEECHVNNSCCADFFSVCGLAKSTSSESELKTVYQDNSTTKYPFQPNTTAIPFSNLTTLIVNRLMPIVNSSSSVTVSTSINTNNSVVINNSSTQIPNLQSVADIFGFRNYQSTLTGNNFTTNSSNITLTSFNSFNSTTPSSNIETPSTVVTRVPLNSSFTIIKPTPPTERIFVGVTQQNVFNITNSSTRDTTLSTINAPMSTTAIPEMYNTPFTNLNNQLKTKELSQVSKFDSGVNTIRYSNTDFHNAENNPPSIFYETDSRLVVMENSNRSFNDSNQNLITVLTNKFNITPQINNTQVNATVSLNIIDSKLFVVTDPTNQFVNDKNTLNPLVNTTSNGLSFTLFTTTPKNDVKENVSAHSFPSINKIYNSSLQNNSEVFEVDKSILNNTTVFPNSSTYNNITKNGNFSLKKFVQIPVLEFITPEPPVVFRYPPYRVKLPQKGTKLVSQLNDVFKINKTSFLKATTSNTNLLTTTTSIEPNTNNLLNETLKITVTEKYFTNLFTIFNRTQIDLINQTTTFQSVPPSVINRTRIDSKLNSSLPQKPGKSIMNHWLFGTVPISEIKKITMFKLDNFSGIQATTPILPYMISTTLANINFKSRFLDVLLNKSNKTPLHFYPIMNTSMSNTVVLQNTTKTGFALKEGKNISAETLTTLRTTFTQPFSTSRPIFSFYDKKNKDIIKNINVIPAFRPIKIDTFSTKFSNLFTTSTALSFTKKKTDSKILPFKSNPVVLYPLSINTKLTTAKNALKEMYDDYWRSNISSVDGATKWRSKYLNKGSQASYYRESTHIITPSFIIGIILAILTVSVIVLTIACLIHRRRVNQNDNSVEDSDVQYLTSDEIINFNWARPSPDRQDEQPASKQTRPKKSVPQDCIRLVDQ